MCHSCYAFSAAGALESALAIQTGQLHTLSEQQIVDCSSELLLCSTQRNTIFSVVVYVGIVSVQGFMEILAALEETTIFHGSTSWMLVE